MKEAFKVSVIIPVYNAGKFVTNAVESALAEDEVGEVLLIEDASPDNALQVCQQLAEKYEKVKLLQHPDKMNHGAAASRNLGIVNAEFNYIAFLDADDAYIQGRFKLDKHVFNNDCSVDGIYHATTCVALDSIGNNKLSMKNAELLTMKRHYNPEELFENLSPVGYGGFFYLNSLTVKRSVFKLTGLMNPVLRLSQDTDICIKLAAICKLVPGDLVNPVALYGLHEHNRSLDEDKIIINRTYLFYQLYKWGIKKKIGKKRIFLLWQRFYEYNILINNPNRVKQIALLLNELLVNPSIICSRFFCKQLPIINRLLP